MMFRTCKLYEKVKNVDEFGNTAETYRFITDIEMDISTKEFRAVENGIVYHSLVTVGVTPYDGFELNKTYKVADGEMEYMCDTFIPSRLTNLTLTRLV